MARKTFVIDTNVLLHDPQAIFKFPDNNIVLPVAVLDELGAMKRFVDERGKNARAVIRLLSSLEEDGNFHDGIELENKSTVRIQLDVRDAAESAGVGIPFIRNSKILTAAYLLLAKDKKVVFVTKDLVSRIKAEAVGLQAEDYENLKFSFDKVYKGLRKLEVAKRDVDLFYKDGGIKVEGEFYPNEYCVMTSPEQSSAVGKYDSIKDMIVPLLKLPDHIWGVKPLNVQQRCALDLLLRDDIKCVSLMGPAGTGKTLLALACGLRRVFDEGTYNKILISRPIIPLGKDIGYLPGTKEEKLYHWMQPIYDNLEFLCGASNADETSETLRWVTESKKLEMEAVTYIRGRSLPKIYMIIDEAQNLTPHEMKTIISRAGDNTKVILAGDPTQIDNPYLDKNSNGMTFTLGTFKNKKLFGHVFLEKTERSELAALAAECM